MEVPIGFEPMIKDLQSFALNQTWLWYQTKVLYNQY